MEHVSQSEKITRRHRITIWCRNVMSDYVFLIILASITGTLCGIGAYVLKWLLSTISGLFMPHIRQGDVNWWLAAVPVAGIVATGVITRYVMRYSPTHGVAQLVDDLKKGRYLLRPSLTVTPIITSSITLGMGGTSGSEGPIAYAGAAIGSNIGRITGLPPSMVYTLIGCGAGAGIAGIFIAPIGGVLFVIEVLRMRTNTLSALALVVACVFSWLSASLLNGFGPDLAFASAIETKGIDYGCVALLGVFCGFYSMYYSVVMERMDSFFKQFRNPWMCNITGGAIIGICLLLFPSMYCVGYPVIDKIINGHPEAIAEGSALLGKMPDAALLFTAGACILVLKCWGVAATNSSGGVGGDFAPTLFAGSIAGFLFALLYNSLTGSEIPVPLFAFLGMAGVMSGAIEAPLMTIFITLEMTGNPDYALPVTMTAVISYLTERTGRILVNNRERMILHTKLFGH